MKITSDNQLEVTINQIASIQNALNIRKENKDNVDASINEAMICTMQRLIDEMQADVQEYEESKSEG